MPELNPLLGWKAIDENMRLNPEWIAAYLRPTFGEFTIPSFQLKENEPKTIYTIEQIKIAPVTFDVRHVEDLTSSEGETIDGHFDPSGGEIVIREGLNRDAAIVTMWHEVLHGFLEQAGYTDHPEDMINAISYGIVNVIRDNPELIEATTN